MTSSNILDVLNRLDSRLTHIEQTLSDKSVKADAISTTPKSSQLFQDIKLIRTWTAKHERISSIPSFSDEQIREYLIKLGAFGDDDILIDQDILANQLRYDMPTAHLANPFGQCSSTAKIFLNIADSNDKFTYCAAVNFGHLLASKKVRSELNNINSLHGITVPVNSHGVTFNHENIFKTLWALFEGGVAYRANLQTVGDMAIFVQIFEYLELKFNQ